LRKSYFIIFVLFVTGFTVPSAFADHATATVSVPQGTSVPGCEATNECYIPFEVRIDVGGVVTWVNDDSAAHTVTGGSAADGPSGVFDSSLFMAGTTFEHKFERNCREWIIQTNTRAFSQNTYTSINYNLD
jgi:plastocyanin